MDTNSKVLNMVNPPIDYSAVHSAINFYKNIGYRYMEVPWVVSPEAYNITCPKDGVAAVDKIMVASGEQSFLQMAMDNEIETDRYVAATPCYRKNDYEKSPFHWTQFFKIELFEYVSLTHDQINISKGLIRLNEIVEDANLYIDSLFLVSGKLLYLSTVPTLDDERLGCITHRSMDIVTSENLELGSYGVRTSPLIGTWIYGTGLALPRTI